MTADVLYRRAGRLALIAGILALLSVALTLPAAAQDGLTASDPLPALTVPDLLTIAGLSVVASIIIEAILRLLRLPAETQDRIGLVLALGVSIVVGVLATLAVDGDVAQGILNGILVAGGSTLAHATGKTVAG
jgi:hypothetical protein